MNLRLRLRRPHKGWLVLIPSLVIIGLMILFTPPTSASQAPSASTGALPQAKQPVCTSCHAKEYEAWKSSPHGQQAGATCENCHGPYKADHPNKASMQLPMASDTCRTCHGATFKEWESSQHASKNIDCFDCHNAHTQGLRAGGADKLCAACHADTQKEVTHATHGVNGVTCLGCHMASASGDKAGMAKQTNGAAPDHTFKVSSDVCTSCHQQTIHTSNTLVSLKAAADPAVQTQAQRVPDLEKQVTDLNGRLDSMRNAAATSMGLALGFGGVVGILVGIAGAALLRRRSS